MAVYQNENEKRKQELLKAFQQQQKLEEYQKNKSNLTDYIKQGNNYRTELGTLGKTLSGSDNTLVSNLGNNLYKYAGQGIADSIKSNVGSNLGLSLGSTAPSASALSSGSALTNAISSSAPIAETAANSGTMTLGLTNPVTAGIIAAAMIGNQLYSSKKQKDEQALKLSQQEAAQGQNTALNNKNNAISNIEQQNNNQLVDDLKNQYLTQEQTINTPISAETQLQNSDEKQNIISDIFNKFKEGYSENRNNGFEPENLEKTDKSVWNRLGEAVGTGARVLSNPALQGLIAGSISGISNKNWAKGLEYGVNWAKDKAKSDMYNKLITNEQAAPILGKNLSSTDYGAKTLGDYRDTVTDINATNAKSQLDKTNPTMENFANTMYASGAWNLDDYNNFISGENYNPNMRLSTETIKIMSDKNRKDTQNANDTQKTQDNTRKIDNDIEYKNTMLNINQQNADTNTMNANTNAQKAGEQARHNKESENLIRQKLKQTQTWHNIQSGFKQAELDLKKAKASGLTPNQQLSIAKNVRDSAIDMINNLSDKTDEEKAVLSYEADYQFNKTLRSLGMTDNTEENKNNNDPMGLFNDDKNLQFDVFEPTEPTTPPKPPKRVPVI